MAPNRPTAFTVCWLPCGLIGDRAIPEQTKKHLPGAKAQERVREAEEKAKEAAEAAAAAEAEAAEAAEAPAEEAPAEEAPAEEAEAEKAEE